MKNYLTRLAILLIVCIGFSCGNSETEYDVADCFATEQVKHVIDTVVRYMAKLPPMANHTNKFESRFNEYYTAVATDYDIRLCYKNQNTYYVLFTRAARSITPMREAIGCKIKMNGNKFDEYEEVFRTWKMSDNILRERYPLLFEKMILEESLEPYYAKNKGDQYIEFPDDRFYFDKESRIWKDHVFDSIPHN